MRHVASYKSRCIYCGASFIVAVNNNSNICNLCKTLISEPNYKRNRGKVEVSCLSCGNSFVTSYGKLRAGRGKYCSKVCKLKYRGYDRHAILKEGNVIKIEIVSKDKKTIRYAIIDADDYNKIRAYKWSVIGNSTTLYAATNIKVDGMCKIVRMHALILDEVRTGCIIDHINHDGLDNRKCNLRKCTQSENTCNSRKSRGCISIFKGVSMNVARTKYTSNIRIDGILKSLGRFDDPVDAAIAYDYAATILHGEFAHINFPFMTGHYDEVPAYIIRNVINGMYGSYRNSKQTSVYCGVGKTKSGSYTASIKIGDINTHIGTYKDEICAAMNRDLYVLENNLKRNLNSDISGIVNYFNDSLHEVNDG